MIKINLLELTQSTKKEVEKFDKIKKDDIYKILANLFTLWTISDFYDNKLKLSDSQEVKSVDYLLRPHPSQVISILRILGHGYENVV